MTMAINAHQNGRDGHRTPTRTTRMACTCRSILVILPARAGRSGRILAARAGHSGPCILVILVILPARAGHSGRCILVILVILPARAGHSGGAFWSFWAGIWAIMGEHCGCQCAPCHFPAPTGPPPPPWPLPMCSPMGRRVRITTHWTHTVGCPWNACKHVTVASAHR